MLQRKLTYVAAMLAGLVCGLAPASADELRDAVESTLGASYPFFALRAGADFKLGSPEEKASLQLSVDGIMKLLPPDCTPETFRLTVCGLGTTLVGSDAMAPTLWAREAVFFVPYSGNRAVQRGDVVVFNVAQENDPEPLRHMFRAIGLPGETIELVNGVVNVNGRMMELEPTGKELPRQPGSGGLELFHETTPEGQRHLIARKDDPDFPQSENAGAYVVPEGHIFVLGDNRHNAADSRFPHQLGGSSFVSLADVVGRVALIYVSADASRTGKAVDVE